MLFKKWLTALGRAGAWLSTKIDRGDVQFVIGLAITGYGISLIDVAWAFIVVGAVLMFTAYARELAGLVRLVRLGSEK